MTIIRERKRDPLEDLFSMMGDLRKLAQNYPSLITNESVRNQSLTLLDTIANEISETAGRIKTLGIRREDDLSLKLVQVVLNAFEPVNRPKIYDDVVLFDVYYALQDASLGKLRPITLFIVINDLERKGIKAHYSGCECPLYLLKLN